MKTASGRAQRTQIIATHRCLLFSNIKWKNIFARLGMAWNGAWTLIHNFRCVPKNYFHSLLSKVLMGCERGGGGGRTSWSAGIARRCGAQKERELWTQVMHFELGWPQEIGKYSWIGISEIRKRRDAEPNERFAPREPNIQWMNASPPSFAPAYSKMFAIEINKFLFSVARERHKRVANTKQMKRKRRWGAKV